MMAALGEMPSGAGLVVRDEVGRHPGHRRGGRRRLPAVVAEQPRRVRRLSRADRSGRRRRACGSPPYWTARSSPWTRTVRPSFGLLQRRMHVRDPRHLRHLITEVPVSVRLFDVLRFDGKSLLEATYDDRRGLLDSLDIGDPFWETPPRPTTTATRRWTLSASTGLEGVVAKRRKSRYLPGRRSADWIKVKPVQTRDVILCGLASGGGQPRPGKIGSFYCGAYTEPGGELVLIGKVGSGLDFATLDMLCAELAGLEIDRPPFDPVDHPHPRPPPRPLARPGPGRRSHLLRLGRRRPPPPPRLARPPPGHQPRISPRLTPAEGRI